VILGGPAAINISRVWIIVAAVCELRAQVARSHVQAIIFVKDRIMVVGGCQLRARITRSESQANTLSRVFILVAAGG
jgi:hypothetical protein